MSDGGNDRHSDDQTTHDDSAKHVTEQELPNALYLALEKPEVAHHWNSQIDVLKTGERAASIHALVDVRDGVGHSNTMAKVNAARTLLDQGEAAAAAPRGTQQTAGLIIVMNGATNPEIISPRFLYSARNFSELRARGGAPACWPVARRSPATNCFQRQPS